MNTMVSAASLATATAVTVPPTAAATSTTNVASFPALVARFLQVHERWTSRRAKDKAYNDLLKGLLFDATGITYEEFGTLDALDPRRKTCAKAIDRIINENPENDPVDEHGHSIAWDEICGDLKPVAEAILRQPATSVVDLAWQAEAIVTWDTSLLEGDDVSTRLLKKLFENIRTLSGPLPLLGETAEISAGSNGPHDDRALLEAGDKFDEAAKHLIKADARADELFEPINEAIEAQATWSENQRKWSSADAKNYHKTWERTIDDIGAEWSALTEEISDVHYWRIDAQTRAIWAMPAHSLPGVAVQARVAALACKSYWDEPFDDLDWEAKATRALIEAILDAAGRASAPEYLGIEEAT